MSSIKYLHKEKNDISTTENSLTLAKTNALKGLFAIMVLLHHIGQNTAFLNGTFTDKIIETLGYLSVSVFLFLSGYGLCVSYKLKGENYIKTFPKNKILPFYIQNLILIAIYFIFWQIIGETLSTRRIVLSFFFGHTVIKYGWYIQTTLLLYFLFFVAFKAKDRFMKTAIFTLGYIGYFGLCYLNNCWSMWYISVLAFVTGVAYANITPNSKYEVLISLLLFVPLYILGNFNMAGTTLTTLFKMCSSVVFPILVVSLTKLLPFKFVALNKLSKISFEIYVSQGLFLTLFHSKIIYIKNEFLYVVLVVIFTIIFSILLNKLFKFVLTMTRPKKA